jgi:ElaB/YqjD/DUF883 family membrane-anchored ribosome-binding protein
MTMVTRTAKAVTAEEIAAIEELMSDLEKRLHRLSGTARRETAGASSDIRDFVSEALGNIMKRVRESAVDVGDTVADEAARYGGDAIKKLSDEIEQRPLIMLGVAAGIGFLIGSATRR